MKKLLLIPLVVFLQSCAIYDAYMMTHYDPNEYKAITDIRAEAQLYKGQCANEMLSVVNANKLAFDTRAFAMYSENVPRNENVQKASVELDKIAQGLATQYNTGKVSPMFCKIKFESVEHNADTMQKIIGARPR
jgi:hypothetical protein